MASVEKISVSVGSDELDWAKKQAKRRRTSLSAVVSEALRRQRQVEAGWRLLDELGTDDITEDDLVAVRKELGWSAPKRGGSRSTERRADPARTTRRIKR